MHRGTGGRGAYVLLNITSTLPLPPRAYLRELESSLGLMHVIPDVNDAALARPRNRKGTSAIRKYRNPRGGDARERLAFRKNADPPGSNPRVNMANRSSLCSLFAERNSCAGRTH